MNDLREIKTFKFGNMLFKIRYTLASGVFDSFICLLDKNMNEQFLGSLGAYSNNDWLEQITNIDRIFMIEMYKRKKNHKGRRVIVIDEQKDVSISLSTFDSLTSTIKSFIADTTFNKALTMNQDDIYRYMPLNNNWIGFEVGSIKFHISSSLEYGHTVSAQNIYTGNPVYNKRFKTVFSAMKSVEKTVDNEIEKHYNEINSLKQCKENITYIADKIVG